MTLTQFVDDLIEYGIDAPAPFGEMFCELHTTLYAYWPTVVAEAPGEDDRLRWIGTDDRRVELEIIGLDLPDYLLITQRQAR